MINNGRHGRGHPGSARFEPGTSRRGEYPAVELAKGEKARSRKARSRGGLRKRKPSVDWVGNSGAGFDGAFSLGGGLTRGSGRASRWSAASADA